VAFGKQLCHLLLGYGAVVSNVVVVVEEWTTAGTRGSKSSDDKAHIVVYNANFADLSLYFADIDGSATLRTLNRIVQKPLLRLASRP